MSTKPRIVGPTSLSASIAGLSRPQAAQAMAKMPNDPLGYSRRWTTGPGGSKAETFLTEHNGGQEFNFEIKNDTAVKVKLLLGGVNHTMFPSTSALTTALGATAVISEGVVYTASTKDVTVTAMDANRNVSHLVNYVGKNPTRIKGIRLTSTLIAGGPDDLNYTGSLETIFVSPFQDPKRTPYGLRHTQDNRSTSTQYAELDFLRGKQTATVMIGDEDFLMITVNPGTILSLNMAIGFQSNKNAEFLRALRAGDEAAQLLAVR